MSAPRPAPVLAGATEVFVSERASATPLGPTSLDTTVSTLADAAIAATAVTTPVTPVRLGLREAQAWFADVIAHPAGVVAAAAGTGFRPEQVVTAGPRLDAVGRLAVYQHAYRARLVECLADDYPAVRYALGVEAFEGLCDGYITRHPSGSSNLNGFGRYFADFCRPRGEPWASFAADLAVLEWALVEVLHAPEAPPLDPASLASIAPERWAGARLRPSATLRVLHFDYPVDAFFQAFREDRAPACPSPAPSATAVYRHHYVLWRMNLTVPMARLLDDLIEGRTLGEALGSLETTVTDDDERAAVGREVMSWFGAWVSGGFFRAIELPPADEA